MAHQGSMHGRGDMYRGSYTSNWRGDSRNLASPDGEQKDGDDLFNGLKATDILPSGGNTQMTDFGCVASYNWLNSSLPTILVPGSPAVWSPPVTCRKLNPDKGKVFIDQNAARYPSYPMVPMIRAVYEQDPEIDLHDIDVIVDRNSMAKLFDFVTRTSKSFEIDVETIGKKVLFVRREKKSTDIITGFRGFGFTFPEEYTTWDSEVKGSSSHHRIARFEMAGCKYLIRFESDGYLKEKAVVKNPFPSQQGADPDRGSVANFLSPGDSLNISEKQPKMEAGLTLHRKGTEIDQAATIEIKTRAAHKPLNMETVLPRLWMSQTTNVIAAYHKGGRFDDIRILDVHEDLKSWEERHDGDLQKLDALIQHIIDTARSTKSRKCRIEGLESGKLKIRELGEGHQNALPEDLMKKLRNDDVWRR